MNIEQQWLRAYMLCLNIFMNLVVKLIQNDSNDLEWLNNLEGRTRVFHVLLQQRSKTNDGF